MIPPELVAALPESARRPLDPATPLPARMMAAKGMAPLPPLEMTMVLCGLSVDDDPKLAGAAQATLAELPDKILLPALEGLLPPVALGLLAPRLTGRPTLLEKLVLNRATPDETIAVIAADAPAEVAEIIASNQERCLRSAAIVCALARNTEILRSSLERLFDFLVRSGVIHEELPQFGEALARLSPTEMVEAAERIELPSGLEHLMAEAADERPPEERDRQEGDVPEGHPHEGHPREGDNAPGGERQPVLKLVASLSVAQRVALALRGNKEARSILVRDSNRVVASAAIRSPRVTEQEIIAAAQSRSVSDEVVRIICNSKEMTRSYAVKGALVNNPKTPLPVAMRFLTLLRQSDLRAVAKSKNVSSALANQAKRLVSAKQGNV